MREAARMAIANAAESIGSFGVRALDAGDLESAGSAFVAERWLKLFCGAIATPDESRPLAKVEAEKAQVSGSEGAPPKRRGRKPKETPPVQQDLPPAGARDTEPPPPPAAAGMSDANGHPKGSAPVNDLERD